MINDQATRRATVLDFIAVVLLVVLVVWLLSSCHTFDAVTDAPVEFWETLGVILSAVWADVMALVDLVL